MTDRDYDEAMYQQHKDWKAEQEYYASESAKAEADIKANEIPDESLLLSDEEIMGIYDDWKSESRLLNDLAKLSAKAQLAKAYPLIRAEVLREVGEWLEKYGYWELGENYVSFERLKIDAFIANLKGNLQQVE